MRGSRRRRDEAGSVAVEIALLAPALVLVLGLLVAGGRLWFARTTVVEAAQTSARSASLARDNLQSDEVPEFSQECDGALLVRFVDTGATE